MASDIVVLVSFKIQVRRKNEVADVENKDFYNKSPLIRAQIGFMLSCGS